MNKKQKKDQDQQENQKSIKNFCMYSFKDLFEAAEESIDLNIFYQQDRNTINNKVKELCNKINWIYMDIQGNDGITYTAFAPNH